MLDWEIIPSEIDCTVWVGLFGNLNDFPEKQTVIEDGAQHFGAPLQGISAAYSFDPTKGLPNFGNGGAVVSNSMTVIQNIKHRFNINSHSISNITPMDAYTIIERTYSILENMYQPCEKF